MAAKVFGFDETFVYTAGGKIDFSFLVSFPRWYFQMSVFSKEILSQADCALSLADFATFRGNTKIRALMQQPGGACITAAEGSGGSVFNGNKWVTSKAVGIEQARYIGFMAISSWLVTLKCTSCVVDINASKCNILSCFLNLTLLTLQWTTDLYNATASLFQLLEKKFLRVMAQRVSISTSAPDCQECQCTGGSRGTMVKCYQCSEAPDVSEISPLDFITPSAKSGDDMDADEEVCFYLLILLSEYVWFLFRCRPLQAIKRDTDPKWTFLVK